MKVYDNSYHVIDPQRTGTRIKQIRQKNNVTVEQLRRYLGFENPQAIYYWQSGKCMPTLERV